MTICLNDHSQQIFQKLFEYVKKNNYEGNDLFDGLNSKLFKNTIFYKIRLFRLALIQFCKLSPVNLRKLLLVSEGFNPKAGALFLLGNLNMYKATANEEYKQEAQKLYGRLRGIAIKREKGIGWGYNFDWQARAFFVPEGTPNIVTSVYVGKALIEYYKVFKDMDALKLAKQIAEFILNEMVIVENEDFLCFRYIPNENAQVHNANLLAASFLASMKKHTISKEFADKAKKAMNFSIVDVNSSGAWAYGTKPFHRWVDNFHTAFNIESLIDIRDNLRMPETNKTIKKITEYYINNLFTEQGVPKYYSNKLYPIDIHVIAETLIVLDKIKKAKILDDYERLDIINDKVLELVKSFQSKKGYFYFRKNKYFWNKIPYIRWGQAWMFFALSHILPSKT